MSHNHGNYMIMTLNFSQFYDNWPESRKGQFSYEGLKALFDYLEEYEDSTDEKIEFDPIAICCDYTEYDNELAGASEYGFKPEETETTELIEKEAEQNEEARLWLEDRTSVIECENGHIIIQNF